MLDTTPFNLIGDKPMQTIIEGPAPPTCFSPSSGTHDISAIVSTKIADAAAWFANIVGRENVLCDDFHRSNYGKTTLPAGTTPAMIVQPKLISEVQAIVVAANHFGLKIHAISRGKNWGYGDACAPTDGQLIVDCRRMDRIIEINEELAYAVIEPGVTQGQLANALLERNSRLMLDVTGAGPDASIVGNILQRGFGHTPYGDRVSNSCNYQIVALDGTISHTGFGNVVASNVGHVYPYGRGPDLRGMHCQSNQGIVTRMTVWLMPRPECISAFAFKVNTTDQFMRAIDCVGRLRQSGTINSVVHVANDLRVLSTQSWLSEAVKPDMVIDESTRSACRKRAGVARWNALGGLYGTKQEVRARQKAIRAAFQGICPVYFVSERIINVVKSIIDRCPPKRIPERIGNFTNAVFEAFQLLRGVPSAAHLEGAFFRNRPTSGQVIDAGLIWIAPVIPCTGQDACNATQAMEKIANKHGFDLPVTISPVTPRAAICVANLSYNKTSVTESQRATEAYLEIEMALSMMGYPAYRVSSLKWSDLNP